VSCRPEALDERLPGPFRALGVTRRVSVAKRKHGDRHDRWRWEGDLVGTAGRGWRVVRHLRGVDPRVLFVPGDAEPQSAVTLRWLGTRAPATILAKLDDDLRIVEVKIDAALPVPFRRGRFLFTDLDVDVVRDAAGAVVIRDWDVFDGRAALLGYTDATRAVARAGEELGLRLLAAWEPTLELDVAAILAAIGTSRLAEPSAGTAP
jgi:hypothetical protein